MRGWRGFIGRVEPSMWYEGKDWAAMLPPGVDLVLTCLGVRRLVQEELEAAYAEILDRVGRLAHARVDVINLGGSPVVTSRGMAGHEELLARARAITEIPIITSLMAELDAFRALGAGRIAIAAPYPNEQTERRRRYLEELGFEVVAAEGLGIETTDEIARLDETMVYRLVRKTIQTAPEAEAIYIPCGSFPVVHLIKEIEHDTGLPVVTNSQAQAWACLKAIGCQTRVPGFGRLMEL